MKSPRISSSSAKSFANDVTHNDIMIANILIIETIFFIKIHSYKFDLIVTHVSCKS